METKYAPAKRSGHERILTSNLSLDKINFLNDIFCSISILSVILDDNRQIVYANDNMMKTVQAEQTGEILGKRFGESINCRFAFKEEGGCGTSEHCQYCGVVNATLQSQITGIKTTSECRIRRMINDHEQFLDIEVTATPFSHEQINYTIFSFIDITDRKRRAVIEKIFFHDLMNAATGLQGFFDLFESLDEEEKRGFIQAGASLCQQMMDEIITQRLITQAENHELVVDRKPIDALDFIHHIARDFQFHDVAKEKNIVISENSAVVRFDSDPVILRRILINMVKNALEASHAGQTVTLKVEEINQKLKLSVHNGSFIPRHIEMQVFMRSFSTKGVQRGLGTYSMKILGEEYLGGKVDFTTSEADGTSFFIVL